MNVHSGFAVVVRKNVSFKGEAACQSTSQQQDTHEPSGRRDSGITRSRVRGSSAIPAAEVSGMIGGFDMLSAKSRVIAARTRGQQRR